MRDSKDIFAAANDLVHEAKKQKLEEDARKSVSDTRAQLLISNKPEHAFFASLAYKLRYRLDWSVPTAAVDGKTMLVNPQFWMGMTLQERVAVFAHEIMHCVLKHHVRRGRRDPQVWNLAGDGCINVILRESGFKLPDKCFYPSSVGLKDEGWMTEPLYDELMKQCKQQGKDGEAMGSGYSDLGSVRDGHDGKDGQDGSDASKAEQEAEWDMAMAQAKQAAKSKGNVPGSLSKLVDEMLEPKVDWKAQLREFVNTRSRDDFAIVPPNRRYMSYGLALPSLDSLRLGSVVVFADTSGSVMQCVPEFCYELEGILRAFDCDLTILWHDTQVAHVQEWKSSDGPLVAEPHGFGGTDHRPCFEYVEEHELNPKVVIALTDLYSSFPSEPPDYPIMWVTTRDHGHVPFGSHIAVPEW